MLQDRFSQTQPPYIPALSKQALPNKSVRQRRPHKIGLSLIVEIPGQTERHVTLTAPAMLIGRSSSADVKIDSPLVSRQHARIIQIGNAYWLTDLGSTNGSSINGNPVRTAQLSDGDCIVIGAHTHQPVTIRVRIGRVQRALLRRAA